MSSIEEAIQQKQFKSEFQKAHINIIYTAACLTQMTTQALKPYNLSWQQFNILRILRGQQPRPASIKLLTDRMLDKMSNASRIVDKLEAKGLVVRTLCPFDRRRVDINLTQAGTALIAQASQAVDALHSTQYLPIDEADAQQLNQLLDTLRSGMDTSAPD